MTGLKRHCISRWLSGRLPAADTRRCGDGPRLTGQDGFSHVVLYSPRSALGAAMVDSLLDAASHGPTGRWVLLCPTR